MVKKGNEKMIIIIGAESFVGTYLVDALVKLNKELIVTGRSIESNSFFKSLNKTTAINLDISQEIDFKKLPTENIEAVIHLAGIMPANVEENDYNPFQYIDVNIKGTLNTLEYCRLNKIKKIIYTSSESDISEQYDKYEILNEDIPRAINYNNDHTIYAITKIASMDLIKHYSEKYNIQGVYFRLPNIFGYGQLLEHYKDGKKVLNGFGTFLNNAMKGYNIELWGDPKKGRDIIYVKDLVQMIVNAIFISNANGLYCVGTGIKTTLLEQVEKIIEVFSPQDIQKKSKIIFKRDKPSVRSYIYDVKKAKNDLNYEVQYPYERMLIDWKKELKLDRFSHLRNRVSLLLQEER